MSVPHKPGTTAYRLYQLAWAGLDWVYPPLCSGCGAQGSRWCEKCIARTNLIEGGVCLRCGIEGQVNGICSSCYHFQPAYTALRSWAYFEGPVRNALHRLKYMKDVALGEVLSRHLMTLLDGLNWRVDLVVPVPLGIARQSERGYNQASLLARPLALASGIRYHSNALVKKHDTRSQVGLSITQRKTNVKDVFSGNNKVLSGKRVLLVDDVCTSGATIESCAQALFEAGAKDVYALTLARARFSPSQTFT
jgi:competence protein ComFC